MTITTAIKVFVTSKPTFFSRKITLNIPVTGWIQTNVSRHCYSRHQQSHFFKSQHQAVSNPSPTTSFVLSLSCIGYFIGRTLKRIMAANGLDYLELDYLRSQVFQWTYPRFKLIEATHKKDETNNNNDSL